MGMEQSSMMAANRTSSSSLMLVNAQWTSERGSGGSVWQFENSSLYKHSNFSESLFLLTFSPIWSLFEYSKLGTSKESVLGWIGWSSSQEANRKPPQKGFIGQDLWVFGQGDQKLPYTYIFQDHFDHSFHYKSRNFHSLSSIIEFLTLIFNFSKM